MLSGSWLRAWEHMLMLCSCAATLSSKAFGSSVSCCGSLQGWKPMGPADASQDASLERLSAYSWSSLKLVSCCGSEVVDWFKRKPAKFVNIVTESPVCIKVHTGCTARREVGGEPSCTALISSKVGQALRQRTSAGALLARPTKEKFPPPRMESVSGLLSVTGLF